MLSLFFCESEIEELLPLPPPDRGQLCVPGSQRTAFFCNHNHQYVTDEYDE